MRYGSAQAKGGDARPSPECYEWKPPGRAISVRVSLAVIDQLDAAVMKGFRSVPERGAEIGGVLFGHVAASEEEALVYVEGYEPVECEYRRGASYVLSQADRRRLERTLRKGSAARQVVGFYRSHTRLGLYLDQDDFSLIQSYFPGAHQVFLLMRPHAGKPTTAGLFFWEEGTIHRQSTYLEFPFNRAAIVNAGAVAELRDRSPAELTLPKPPLEPSAPVVAPPEAGPGPVSVQPITPRPATEPRPHPMVPYRHKAGWGPVAVAACALLCVAAIEYQVLRFSARRPAATLEAEYSPALRVERSGNHLRVGWNQNAPSVLHAERATLRITDGAATRELRLDARQARTGSVLYRPFTKDVSFRLELVGAKTTVSESLRVVETAGPSSVQRPPAARTAPLPAVRPPAAAVAGAKIAPAPIPGARPPRTAAPPASAAAAPVYTAKASPAPRVQPPKRLAREHPPAWYDDGL